MVLSDRVSESKPPMYNSPYFNAPGGLNAINVCCMHIPYIFNQTIYFDSFLYQY